MVCNGCRRECIPVLRIPNVTYRVYDYGRVGKDGKKRDLHIEKALAVTNRVPIVKDKSSYPHVADCDYFTVDKLNLDGNVMKNL